MVSLFQHHVHEAEDTFLSAVENEDVLIRHGLVELRYFFSQFGISQSLGISQPLVE